MLGWLHQASAGRVTALDFIEPNLALDAKSDGEHGTTIVVILRGEAAPPTMTDEERWSAGLVLELDVSHDSLRNAAAEWERELAPYPPR